MSKIEDGGPAFPSHGSMGEVSHEGMTLRDYFAAKAMQGLIYDKLPEQELRTAAKYSYAMADAMLAERKK